MNSDATRIVWGRHQAEYGMEYMATFGHNDQLMTIGLERRGRNKIGLNRVVWESGRPEWKRTGVYKGTLKSVKENIHDIIDRNDNEYGKVNIYRQAGNN